MGAYIINIPSTVDRIIYTNVDPMNGKTYIASYSVDDLTPYTGPDFEQVKCEAYEEGRNSLLIEVQKAGKNKIKLEEDEYYQRGLSDAWEAARKICTNWVLPDSVLSKIFGMDKTIDDIMKESTASEAIEKIRAYEQEQEEQITKGDIVLIRSTPEVEIFVTYADEEYVSGIALTEVDGYCEIGDQYIDIRISDVEKTGKHYDIVSVLQKMREESNG